MSDFYVYAWLRPCGEPFYIGKGRGKRAGAIKSSNQIFVRIVDKIKAAGEVPSVIKIAENLSESEAFEVEKAYIKKYGRRNNFTGVLANLTDGGEGQSGWIPSLETRAKISSAHKGRKLSEEHKAKIKSSGAGRVVSEQTRQKLSDAFTGRVVTAEHRARISAAHIGKSLSEEHKAKISANSGSRSEDARRRMSESRTGRTHSAETKIKIGDAHRGKVYSEETRAKIGAASLGRKHTKETRERMSERASNISAETREKIATRIGTAHRATSTRVYASLSPFPNG